ncbi:MAG: ApaLI family restriction endonuclease [Planctomycetes bacterium]|nr:ApaLI family restriction endonuclease [Planctomycetota bacterium]
MAKRKKNVAKKKQPSKGVEETIRLLARKYANRLKKVIDQRLEEMKGDDRSHFLIYQVLGVSDQEGRLVDEYQNKGRFLYKYAGSFLEEVAKLCFLEKYPDSGSARIPNTQGRRPKTFQIDCLIQTDAIEIKWRDATTDGDHITEEHTRLQAIVDAKYTPIRVMFYYPNRAQAIKIQQTLETLYKGVNGQYYFGDVGWQYVKNKTGVDLLGILTKLAQENAQKN